MTIVTYRTKPCVPRIASNPLPEEKTLDPTTALHRLAALLVLGAALGAQAANRIYPDTAAPCNTTLQACIDGAGSGDRIVLVTDSYIAEDVLIRKNLTLEPGQAQPSVRSVTALASTADVEVTVRGLTSRGGASRVRGFLEPGGGNLKLTVTGSTLVGRDFNAALEIVISNKTGRYGRAQALFEGNTVSQSVAGSNCAPAIAAHAFNPGLSATLARNAVTATHLGQCAAIGLYGAGAPAAGAWTLDAQVRQNTVRGSGADAGIQVRNGPGGAQVRATVADNLVAGSGFVDGLSALADNANGSADVRLLNNTVVEAPTGLRATARTDLGARLTGVVANNLFAHHASSAMVLENVPDLRDHHNLVFASTPAPGARPDGAGTRHGNPSFANAAAGDYRLRADSDAIDHGDDTAVDSPDGRDLDGQPRRVRTVDMGAYEFQGQAMPPSVVNSVPATGPWALGWVAAMLALAAGWHLRRRG